ncbi:MAG: xylulokinase [Hydrogenophaga sp.]|nr:xylulokinase [Hydrogenophaga sp.]
MTLGIDLGTSGVKALLLEDDRQLAVASALLTVSRPHPGWSEQNPMDWWRATCECLDLLKAEHPRLLAAVRAIGLSGQMHGATLLGADHRVLRPCILWNDGRSEAQCAALEAPGLGLRQRAGNPAMPGFTAPKLLWVREHEPEVFAQVAKVLLPKAWLRWQLCGECAEDMSDASGTLWLDVAARAWSAPLLAACGLDERHMPRLVEGTEPTGHVRADWVSRWGFERPPLVAGGAGDNAAGAVGVGAVAPGDAFVSLGTSGVLWATTAGFAPAPERAVHAFCHALPQTWHQMGVMLSAAASLSWWSTVTTCSEPALLDEVDASATGDGACWFAPYLSGERTPHNDAALRGGFVHLSAGTRRADMTRALLEGVAYAFRDMREALAAAGTTMAQADLIGGGARSGTWSQILADVLGVPLHQVVGSQHGCALGAARLARVAADGTRLFGKPPRQHTYVPDARRARHHDQAFDQWQRLYGRLRHLPSPSPTPEPA